MADVYNPFVARVTAEASQDGQLVTNVTYWRRLGGEPIWDADAIEDLGQAYEAWLAADLTPVQSNSLTWRRVMVTQVKEDGPLVSTNVILSPLTGALTDAPLPNSVAACVGLNTSVGGRSFRGRIYIGGLTESQVSGNTLTVGAQAGINVAVSQLITGEMFAGFEVGVYSRFANKLPRDIGLFTPVVSSGLRDGTVDSQRRRLPGRGR